MRPPDRGARGCLVASGRRGPQTLYLPSGNTEPYGSLYWWANGLSRLKLVIAEACLLGLQGEGATSRAPVRSKVPIQREDFGDALARGDADHSGIGKIHRLILVLLYQGAKDGDIGSCQIGENQVPRFDLGQQRVLGARNVGKQM